MVGRKAVWVFVLAGLFLWMTTSCFADAAGDLKQAADHKAKGYYKQSEDLYKSIIRDNAGTESAYKARQRLAILYIVTERANAAGEQIEAIKNEFAGRPDLPEALYWIAKRYSEEGHADKAASIYQQIISRNPDSRYAKKAQLDIPRTNVLSLLKSGKCSEADAAISKLLSDFAGNPELPETLYDIGRSCKGAGMYARAKGLYQYILQQYPQCSYAELCPLQIAKMDIWAMIASGDFAGTQTAIDKLITDFASAPELPDALHGIALRYEVKDVKRYQDSENLYQRIIQLYPSSGAAKKAAVDIDKSRALSLMASGNDAGVVDAVDKMIAKFPGQKQYLAQVISREIAMRYYNEGMAQGTTPNSVDISLRNATALWERVINQLGGPGVTAEACCYAGNSYLQLGDYQKALLYYQKVNSDYPMYRYGWRALAMAGHACQVMKKTKVLSAAEADAQTKAVYQKLVDTYTECKDAEYAKNWLVNNNNK